MIRIMTSILPASLFGAQSHGPTVDTGWWLPTTNQTGLLCLIIVCNVEKKYKYPLAGATKLKEAFT